MALGDNKQGVRSGPETLRFRGRFRSGAFRARGECGSDGKLIGSNPALFGAFGQLPVARHI